MLSSPVSSSPVPFECGRALAPSPVPLKRCGVVPAPSPTSLERSSILAVAPSPVPFGRSGVVAVFLPRNTDLRQLAALVPEGGVWEVERNYVNRRLKGITLYCFT